MHAMTKDGTVFFVFKHSEAIEFKFGESIEVQMDYFNLNVTF